MTRDNTLDALISNALFDRQKNSKRKLDLANNISGSMLGQPLQSQILHIIGIPAKEFEVGTLKKFERGHDVEAHVKKYMVGHGLLDREAIEKYRKTNRAI